MTTALLVIDVQQGMFAFPDYPPLDGEQVVERIAGLIARARAGDTPVYFVQHDGGPQDEFHPGKPGFPFHAKVAPGEDEDVTVKNRCNSFQGTDLDRKLKAAGTQHVVICGMQTEYCVDTAVRAHDDGYARTECP
jgi:nicotinamidase-related amidase